MSHPDWHGLRCVSPKQATRERADLLTIALAHTDRARGILAASRYLRQRQAAREDRRAFWGMVALTVAAGVPLLMLAHWAGR